MQKSDKNGSFYYFTYKSVNLFFFSKIFFSIKDNKQINNIPKYLIIKLQYKGDINFLKKKNFFTKGLDLEKKKT